MMQFQDFQLLSIMDMVKGTTKNLSGCEYILFLMKNILFGARIEL